MRGCLVVMQPSFIPWAGYFNLLAQADDFVFLDDVQLEKQSWQTRNRIIENGKARWISVPVKHLSLTQKINETEISNFNFWFIKFERSFIYTYKTHPHYEAAQEIIDFIGNYGNKGLAQLNQKLILHVSKQLNLTPRFHFASELNQDGVRSDRLANFCKRFEAEVYLSPVGSMEYLSEDRFNEKTTTNLQFQTYQVMSYPQKGTQEFISHLSILDVVANLGWVGARKYVIDGVL